MRSPGFPPLLHGVVTVDDPFVAAKDMASVGCDPGTVVYNLSGDAFRAALILAPEVPLAKAAAMLPVCGVGFQNALGSLVPPEVAVQLAWDGRILVNGAQCGRLVMRSNTTDAREIPDWLVVGLEVRGQTTTDSPGDTPDETSLADEGCGDLDPVDLLEGWARHTLLWITRWSDDGPAPVHMEFSGLLHRDAFDIGLDEHFGLLRRNGDTTTLIPLTTLLETS